METAIVGQINEAIKGYSLLKKLNNNNVKHIIDLVQRTLIIAVVYLVLFFLPVFLFSVYYKE